MPARPGRPPRSAEATQDRRDEIARHALRLFHDEGFGAVSIRRLAQEAGCAPMTIYAHFAGKTDILRHLWADVLKRLFDDIASRLQGVAAPRDRLRVAALGFLDYWLGHKDDFRLVFISQGVSRTDVGTFMADGATRRQMQVMVDLVRAAMPAGAEAEAVLRTDLLINGLIGIALCANTIADHPWSDAAAMADLLLTAVTADIAQSRREDGHIAHPTPQNSD